MAKRDMPPDEYSDLMIEALRPAVIGPDEAVIGFQIWDMDDFANERTVLFRSRGVDEVERLLALDGLAVDLWFGDDELLVLERNRVHHFRDRRFKKPAATTKLPIKGCKSLVGTSSQALYVLGDGVARYDGKTWKKVDLGRGSHELTVGAMHEGTLYAAGNDGAFFEVMGSDARRLTTPAGSDLQVTGIHVGDGAVFSLAGRRRVALQGRLDALIALGAPEDVNDFQGVAEYQGSTYWSAVGDGDGMGVFVQRGSALELVFPEMCMELRAGGGYLFGTGEDLSFRYDGETWSAIALEYDEDSERWTAVKAEPDGDDDDE